MELMNKIFNKIWSIVKTVFSFIYEKLLVPVVSFIGGRFRWLNKQAMKTSLGRRVNEGFEEKADFWRRA